MPNFNNKKYFVLTEEDFVKTTSLKIKRNVNVDMIHDKLEKAGQTMRETHMKNIDHIA